MIAQSPYERLSLEESRATFADPYRTPVSALVHVVEQEAPLTAFRRGASHVARALLGALDVGFGLVVRTLKRGAVLRGFRRHGMRTRHLSDLARLELWEVDEVADRLPPRYIAMSAALGLAAGSLGKIGLLVDLPVVALLSARAVADYALHYGFDPDAPEEREFARDVLVAALTPAQSVRAASVDELVAAAIAGARAWRRRRAALGAPMLLRLAQRVLATGLSRAQRASVARVGGVATAAVNAWLVVGVMRAARSAYRERFIARR